MDVATTLEKKSFRRQLKFFARKDSGLSGCSQYQIGRIQHLRAGIEPPPGQEQLHRQAISAYEHITYGKLLLPGSQSRLRAEAYFEIDWGIKLLIDYREQLDSSGQPIGRSVG